MDLLLIYLLLFTIIVLVAQWFQRSTIPVALVLVMAGMLLSFVPYFPVVYLDSNLVLNFFLPLLIYQISSFSSWREVKKQMRPIALLSIGHVIFITLLVAIVMHALIPALGWPLSFVLGAIISPPDDVAIISIAEKIKFPERLFVILEGEAIFNDAAALTLFRFALAAVITHQFSMSSAFLAFFAMVVGEIAYGLILGYVIGTLRSHIHSTSLHLIISVITPFVAYIPAEKLGGTGILATATVGFIIGNYFTMRFTPEYRLASLTLWPTLAFAIQSIIFLLVGLDLHATMLRISAIPMHDLLWYVTAIVTAVIVGRFVWVFGALYALPRVIFKSILKNDPYPPWQYPFLLSWAGIRGGISLAAVLAIPSFALSNLDFDPKDLLVFLVFSIIIITLIVQGLSLPYLLKWLGIDQVGRSERYHEHLSELQARKQMAEEALQWLNQYKVNTKKDKKTHAAVLAHIHEYQKLKNEFDHRIADHDGITHHDEEAESRSNISLLLQIIEVERNELTRLWREDKINLRTRNKLSSILDHRIQWHRI